MKMFNRPPKEVPIPDTAISHEQAEVEAYAMKPLLDESIERGKDAQAAKWLVDNPGKVKDANSTDTLYDDPVNKSKFRTLLPGRSYEDRKSDSKILNQESQDLLAGAEQEATDAGKRFNSGETTDKTTEEQDELAKSRRNELATKLVGGTAPEGWGEPSDRQVEGMASDLQNVDQANQAPKVQEWVWGPAAVEAARRTVENVGKE